MIMISDPATDKQHKVSWYRSIRLQMVLAFSLLFSLSLVTIQLGLLYGIPFTRFEGSIRSTIGNEFEILSSLADSRKQIILSWLKGRRNNAKIIAELPSIHGGNFHHDPAVRQLLSHWLEQIRTTYQVEAIRILQPQTGHPLIAVLSPDYNGSILSNAQLQLAATPGMDESIHLVPTPDQKSSRLHIIRQVAQDHSDDGSPHALVVIECDLDMLLKPLLENQTEAVLGKSGELLLLDGERRFLTSTRFAQADGTPVIPLLTVNRSAQAELSTAGGEGTITGIDYHGQEVLAAYRHIQITPDVAWGLSVEKDRSEVLVPLRHHRMLYLVLGGTGLFITILMTAVISHRLSSPLRRMVATSRSIMSGRLDARSAVEGQSEIVELARSFNRMLDQLQSWHDELENRVQQRTKQLTKANLELQREISERIRSEEALHDSTIQLEEEIAERQKMHETLERLNTTLEERITAAISDLRKKDELLIQQSRQAAMGELLSSIAHHWRQPLNNISAYIQNMLYLNKIGELTQDEMERDIKDVMDILLRMSRTIDDFRSFFSQDRSKLEFVVQKTVEKTINLLRSALDDKNIQVSITAQADVRAIGYPNEYAQALMNIINNARDALIERSVPQPKIEIAIRREEGRSVLTVRDNGGGIAPEIMPHIFDPYVTTKGPASGTGIGLYMARTIIEMNMGGELSACNTREGAEFRIVL